MSAFPCRPRSRASPASSAPSRRSGARSWARPPTAAGPAGPERCDRPRRRMRGRRSPGPGTPPYGRCSRPSARRGSCARSARGLAALAPYGAFTSTANARTPRGPERSADAGVARDGLGAGGPYRGEPPGSTSPTQNASPPGQGKVTCLARAGNRGGRPGDPTGPAAAVGWRTEQVTARARGPTPPASPAPVPGRCTCRRPTASRWPRHRARVRPYRSPRCPCPPGSAGWPG